MNLNDVKQFVRDYDGEPLTFMEICGTHTSVIAHSGLRSLLSEKIRLVSGPGCPVCVTVSAYVDRLCALAEQPDTVIVTFGDMIRVKGSRRAVGDLRDESGRVRVVYSPFEVLDFAEKEPDKQFVFAAVGFETTAPVYALLLERAGQRNLHNIRLLTSLKTMPGAVAWVCGHNHALDGFIAPGHVCAVTGSGIFRGLAERFGVPFVVAGFTPEQILCAVYLLIKLKHTGRVENLYRAAVAEQENAEVAALVGKYFTAGDAGWRGLGLIAGSGLYLREEYAGFDAGSRDLTGDAKYNPLCRCADVITGLIRPMECPLFGKGCTPDNPQGACMVSAEGTCRSGYDEG